MVRTNDDTTVIAASHRRRVLVTGVAIAVAALLLFVRRTAVDSFFERVQVPPDTVLTTPKGVPQAQYAVNIDPETNATHVIDVTPPPPPPPAPTPKPAPTDTARVRPEEKQPDRSPDLDLGDIMEKDPGARAGPTATEVASVPPRPVEITWPETRKLKQCVGQSVNVRILVSEEGSVQDVRIVPSQILPECADAALAAARHIRFEPGRTGGVPAAMWTDVRIDFQRRD
jgi:protein TonB